MAEEVKVIILKVDLQCSRCHRKIKRVLCNLQDREKIQSIVYDEKNNTVTVSGPFDTDRLIKKICCKACKIIKEIEIPDPPPPPPPPPPPEEKPPPPPPPPPEEKPPPPPPPPEEKPPPPPPPPPEEKPPPPPPPEEKPPPPPEEKPPPPPPPQPKIVEVPCPWPYPYPAPMWPVCCWRPCPCYDYRAGGGRCCSCGRICDEPPAPAPPVYPPPPCSGVGYKIVCEEDPPYTCTIM